MKILSLAVMTVGISLGAMLSAPVTAQAAKCYYQANYTNGTYAGVRDVGRAGKKSRACNRARRQCNRKLKRAYRKGKVGRGAKCRHMTNVYN